jgi:DNA-binding response OmpR family regulator
MRISVLVVEDDEDIAAAIADRLRGEGFEVTVTGDGPSAVAAAESLRPSLVVLDLMLPGMNGIEVCRRIQAERRVPVLMLTARDSETDILVGLGVGADDYMTKPFSPRELVARIHAILRRVSETPDGPLLTFAGIVVDPRTRNVTREGEPVHLTATEFDLLVALAQARGAVRTRDQLLSEVWGYRDSLGSRTVDSHVRSLRRKLGDGLIRTVHAIGYALGGEAK